MNNASNQLKPMKSLLTYLLAGMTAFSLIFAAFPGSADAARAETWRDLPVQAHWQNQEKDVIRTALPQRLDQFQRVGDHLMVIMYPSNCQSVDCGTRDIGVIRGSEMKIVRGVPVRALDAKLILQNGDRVIWAQTGSVTTRWDVYELDFKEGTKVLLKTDVALGRSSQVRVFAAADRLFYEVRRTVELSNGLYSASIYEGEAGEANRPTERNDVYLVNGGVRHASEEIQSVSEDAAVVSKLTFENGAQEIWVHRARESWQLPGSYTLDGHLVGAQFVDDEHVEFFRYQSLVRVNAFTFVVQEIDDYLKWSESPDVQDTYFVAANGQFVFLSEATNRRTTWAMRSGGRTTEIPADAATAIVLKGSVAQTWYNHEVRDVLTGNTRWASRMVRYNFDGTSLGGENVLAADLMESPGRDSVAELNTDGHLKWTTVRPTTRFGSDVFQVDLGSAVDVWMVSHNQVIWRGTDGNLYLGTIKPGAWLTKVGTFQKTPFSSTVFMVVDGQRYTIPNELVYYTWQANFSGVQSTFAISGSDAGTLKFRPGTFIKIAERAEVYMVLADGTRQQIASGEAAEALSGTRWWHGILTVDDATMREYQLLPGAIESLEDIF